MLKGFRDFLLRGNIVELAVAVIIGGAFGAVVKAFTENIVTPLIAAVGGQPDFSRLSFTINSSQFLYGNFINAIVTFIITAAVIYFLVVTPMNRLMAMRKKEEEAPKAPAEDIVLLREIRDSLARRSS